MLLIIFYEILFQTGLDIKEARSHEERVMLADANKLLNYKNLNERSEIYRHPKSGATPLHVAAAKGYGEVLRSVTFVLSDKKSPFHVFPLTFRK